MISTIAPPALGFAGYRHLLGGRPEEPRREYDAEGRLWDEAGRLGSRAGRLEGGADAARGAALGAFMDFDPEKFLGSDALKSILDSAMPAFRSEVAGVRGANERRGIRGPLASAREGDVVAAFDRNQRETVARFAAERARLSLARAEGISERADSDSDLAFSTRGQALETLAGMADRETARANADEERRSGRNRQRGAGIGALLGGGAGFLLGGPVGAGAGATVGSQVGAGFFG